MIRGIIVIWQLIAFAVIAAIATAAVAVAMVVILAVALYGLVAPNRTVRSVLDALVTNVEAGAAHVRALRPPSRW